MKIPKDVNFQYKDDNGDWKPATLVSHHKNFSKLDQYNQITIEPVTTTAIRMNMTLTALGCGVYRWKVYSDIPADFGAESALGQIQIPEADGEDIFLDVTNKLTLPADAFGGKVGLTWKSKTPEVISDDGTITAPSENTTITLEATAEIISTGVKKTKDFTFHIVTGHDCEKHEEKAATCTKPGNIAYYECKRCGRFFADEANTQEITKEATEIPATGHTPGDPVRENEVAATCEADGSYDEVVYCNVCTEGLSREPKTIPAPGHEWGTPEFTWNGYARAAAKRSCTRDASHEETKDAVITSAVTKEATNDADGVRTYTAKVTFDSVEYTGTKEEIIPATGYTYGKPEWTWAEDGSSATAKFTAQGNASVSFEKNAEIEVQEMETACTGEGSKKCKASVTYGDQTYTDIQTFTLPQLGHDWNAPEFTWTGYGKAVAVRSCKRDASHTQTADAVITSTITREATAIRVGIRTYTATVTFDGENYTDTKEEAIFDKNMTNPTLRNYAVPSVSHKYSEAQGADRFTDEDTGTFWNAWGDTALETEAQWMMYDFGARRATVSGSEIQFYDDNGGVMVPTDIKMEYSLDGVTWTEVTRKGDWNLEANKVNTIEFEPVELSKIRVTMIHAEKDGKRVAVAVNDWKLTGEIPDSFPKSDLTLPDVAVYAAPKAHFTSGNENLNGINNADFEPARSSDGTGKGWGNWPQSAGTKCWVEYDWGEKITAKTFQVYWYADGGGLMIPSDVNFEYKDDGGNWKPITLVSAQEDILKADQYNQIIIEPVTTKAIRMNMTLTAPGCGIYRWKVYSADESNELLASSALERVKFPEIPEEDKGKIFLDKMEAEKLTFPANDFGGKVGITWESSKPDVIGNDGTITTPAENTEVTLTATAAVKDTEVKRTKDFTFTVVPGHDCEKHEEKAATCTKPGNITYYTCKRCERIFADEENTQEITEETTVIPAAGHTPGTPERLNEVPVTCEAGGSYEEVVYCAVCGEELSRTSKTIEAPGHDWGTPVFTWNGYDTATAKRICANDASHEQTQEAVITSAVTKEATAADNGVKTYTAKASFDGTEYTDTKEEIIPATGYTYGVPIWTWEDDGSAATAVFTANENTSVTASKSAKIDAEETKATCTGEGSKKCTASIMYNGQTYTDTKTVTLPAPGHDWNIPKFTWTGCEKAVAVRSCKRDASHTDTTDAAITSRITKKPSAVTVGTRTYTAKATIDGKEYTDTKEAAILCPSMDNPGLRNYAVPWVSAKYSEVQGAESFADEKPDTFWNGWGDPNINTTAQQMEYDFGARKAVVSGSEILFYDDGGGVVTPKDIKVEYSLDGTTWTEVTKKGEWILKPNEVSTITFEPVELTKIRVTMIHAEMNGNKMPVAVKDWKLTGEIPDSFPKPEVIPPEEPSEDLNLPDAAVYAVPTAHFTSEQEKLDGINNADFEPASSDNGTGKGWGNYGHPQDSDCWVEYDWDEKITTKTFQVYWYADRRGLWIPADVNFQYKDEEGKWQQAKLLSYSRNFLKPDQYNQITIEPVTTKAIRMNMTLSGAGCGIYRWKVYSDISDDFAAATALDRLQIPEIKEGSIFSDMTEKLTLPADAFGGKVGITWKSSKPEVVNVDGTITAPAEDTEVTLTATAAGNGTEGEKTKDFTFKVISGHDCQLHEEKAATCTEDGNIAYYTCKRCGKIFRDEEGTQLISAEETVVKAKGHTPGTAVRENEVAATCEKAGSYDEVVKCTVCGEEISRETKTIEALGHDWSTPKFTWSGFDAASAKRSCARNASHVQTQEAVITSVVTKEATATDTGIKTYTAAVTFDGTKYTDTKEETIPAAGYTYGIPVWTWADDGSSAKAVFTAKEDASVSETVEAAISEEETKATCTAEGSKKYTASVTFKGKPYTDRKTVTIPALGHDWNTPVFTWNHLDSAAAERTCKRDETHKETAEAEITSAVTKEATAKENGVRTYTATVTFDGTQYTETKEETIPATGYTYGIPVWTWADDGSSATAVFTANENKDFTFTQNAKISVEETKPTCAAEGSKKYTASVAYNEKTYTDTKTVSIPKLGHDWNTPVFNWTGLASAAAERTCKRDETHKETANAEITSAVTKEATAAETGVRTYTAKVIFDGTEYTETKEEIIPAAGYTYGIPVWTWADDGSSAKAVFTANEDPSVSETVDAKISMEETKASCTAEGSKKYTANVTYNEKTYTYTKTVSIPAPGHDWNTPVFTWSGYTKAVAERICKRDDTHKETAEAEITSAVTKETTAAETGVRTYTAKVTFDGTEYTDTKEEIIPAAGYTYGTPVWTWADDGSSAKAVFTAKEDSSVSETVDAAISVEETKASCTAEGSKKYTASVTFKGETYTDTKTVTIPALGHLLKKTEEKPATCTEDGNIAAYTCERCGKIFKDEEGTQEIAETAKTIPALGHEYKNGVCTHCGAKDPNYKPQTTSDNQNTDPNPQKAAESEKTASDSKKEQETTTVTQKTTVVSTTTRYNESGYVTSIVEKTTDKKSGKTVSVVTATCNAAGTPKQIKVKTYEKTEGKIISTYKVEKKELTLQKVKTAAKTVSIPNTVKVGGRKYKVTQMEKDVFKNDKTLKKLVVGKNIKKINRAAFKGCKNLTSVTFKGKLQSIGKNAFRGNKKLKTIVFKAPVKKIGKNAFKGVKTRVIVRIKKKYYREVVYQLWLSGLRSVSYRRL